jgi:hypothetical protein
MKPYPLAALNHFTVPIATSKSPQKEKNLIKVPYKAKATFGCGDGFSEISENRQNRAPGISEITLTGANDP